MAEVALEPEMYPLVDVPTHEMDFDTFEDLRLALLATSEGLNQVQSWYIYDELDEFWGDTSDPNGGVRAFSLCIFMPRKGQTAVWTTHEFDRPAAQAWLDSYVRARTMRWYGWPDN